MIKMLFKLVVLGLAAVGALLVLDRIIEDDDYVPRGHARRYP